MFASLALLLLNSHPIFIIICSQFIFFLSGTLYFELRLMRQNALFLSRCILYWSHHDGARPIQSHSHLLWFLCRTPTILISFVSSGFALCNLSFVRFSLVRTFFATTNPFIYLVSTCVRIEFQLSFVSRKWNAIFRFALSRKRRKWKEKMRNELENCIRKKWNEII